MIPIKNFTPIGTQAPSFTVPYGFIMCEFIESPGNSYIDTGVIPDSDTSVYFRAQNYGLPGMESCVVGVRDSNNSNWFTVFMGTRQSTIWCDYGANQRFISSGTDIDILNWLDPTDVYLGNGVLKINGTKIGDTYSYNPTNITNSLYIFAFNYNGAANAMHSRLIRLYFLQIYRKDVLIRNFIPCLDLDKNPCLYDSVTGQVYYGTNLRGYTYKFVTDYSQYKLCRYIQSQGSQYMNLCYRAMEDRLIYLDYQYVNTASSEQWIYGSGYGDADEVGYYQSKIFACRGRWGGSSESAVALTIPVDLDRHTIEYRTDGYYMDSEKVGVGSPSIGNITQTLPMCLFARYNDPTARGAIAKIYNFRTKDVNGNITMQLLPSLDPSGTPCMYDIVNNMPFYNRGTGTMTYELVDDSDVYLYDASDFVKGECYIQYGNTTTSTFSKTFLDGKTHSGIIYAGNEPTGQYSPVRWECSDYHIIEHLIIGNDVTGTSAASVYGITDDGTYELIGEGPGWTGTDTIVMTKFKPYKKFELRCHRPGQRVRVYIYWIDAYMRY